MSCSTPSQIREIRNSSPIPFAPFSGISSSCLFLFQLEARRRLRFDLNSEFGLQNLNTLGQTDLETLPHPHSPPCSPLPSLNTLAISNRSSRRNHDQPADISTYGSDAATLVQAVGIVWRLPLSSWQHMRSSPQFWR